MAHVADPGLLGRLREQLALEPQSSAAPMAPLTEIAVKMAKARSWKLGLIGRAKASPAVSAAATPSQMRKTPGAMISAPASTTANTPQMMEG